jgi:hypothetical protein
VRTKRQSLSAHQAAQPQIQTCRVVSFAKIHLINAFGAGLSSKMPKCRAEKPVVEFNKYQMPLDGR